MADGPGMHLEAWGAKAPTAHQELGKINEILRAAGFSYPLGWRGVQDMAGQLAAAQEHADELGVRRIEQSGQRDLAERVHVRCVWALTDNGHHGPDAWRAECSRVLGRPVSSLAILSAPDMLRVIAAQIPTGDL